MILIQLPLFLLFSFQLILIEGAPNDGCDVIRKGYYDYYQCILQCYIDAFELTSISGDLCQGTVKLDTDDWSDVPFQWVTDSIQCITTECRSAIPSTVCQNQNPNIPTIQYGQLPNQNINGYPSNQGYQTQSLSNAQALSGSSSFSKTYNNGFNIGNGNQGPSNAGNINQPVQQPGLYNFFLNGLPQNSNSKQKIPLNGNQQDSIATTPDSNSETTTDGCLDSTTPDYYTTPGDTTPGDTTPGDTTPGDTTPGDTTPGDTDNGSSTPGSIDGSLDATPADPLLSLISTTDPISATLPFSNSDLYSVYQNPYSIPNKINGKSDSSKISYAQPPGQNGGLNQYYNNGVQNVNSNPNSFGQNNNYQGYIPYYLSNQGSTPRMQPAKAISNPSSFNYPGSVWNTPSQNTQYPNQGINYGYWNINQQPNNQQPQYNQGNLNQYPNYRANYPINSYYPINNFSPNNQVPSGVQPTTVNQGDPKQKNLNLPFSNQNIQNATVNQTPLNQGSGNTLPTTGQTSPWTLILAQLLKNKQSSTADNTLRGDQAVSNAQSFAGSQASAGNFGPGNWQLPTTNQRIPSNQGFNQVQSPTGNQGLASNQGFSQVQPPTGNQGLASNPGSIQSTAANPNLYWNQILAQLLLRNGQAPAISNSGGNPVISGAQSAALSQGGSTNVQSTGSNQALLGNTGSGIWQPAAADQSSYWGGLAPGNVQPVAASQTSSWNQGFNYGQSGAGSQASSFGQGASFGQASGAGSQASSFGQASGAGSQASSFGQAYAMG